MQYSSSKNSSLNRGMKNRHLVMMALGGTIGTGLFMGSGHVIHTAGPAGAILAYLSIGILVYLVMTCLGELAAYQPTTGSFCEYSTQYVGKSFGFAMSWNYWVNWALVVASEVIAAGMVMQYWFPDIPVIVWSVGIFFFILGLNILGIKYYSEAEYWLASIKIATIVIFIVVGILSIVGIIGQHGNIGFDNFRLTNGPFNGGLLGFVSAFLTVGYAFQGVELVGVAVGEAETPKSIIGSVSKQIFWRILLFYVLTIVIIAFLIPYNSPALLHEASTVAQSPFTLIFSSAGFRYAASAINVIIATAIISTANASLYTASRVLWHIGQSGSGPKILSRTSKHGVPLIAIAVSALFAGLFVLSAKIGGGIIFTWLMNIIGVAGYIAWFGICLSHYKFRKAYLAAGNDINALVFKAPWYPVTPILAMCLMLLILVGQQAVALLDHGFNGHEFIASYCGLVVFALVIAIHKCAPRHKST